VPWKDIFARLSCNLDPDVEPMRFSVDSLAQFSELGGILIAASSQRDYGMRDY
jgi:hypothetical protein